MRNFEERMTEIKKRSHARIIRRRKQLTALCMPMVAALCVGGALLIQQQAIYKNSDSTQPSGSTIQQYSGSITVVDGDNCITYTNRDKVESVRRLVSNLPPAGDLILNVTQAYSHHIKTTAAVESYAFILEAEDGTTESYTLQGNTLANRSTVAVYSLTDSQRTALLALLELPVK